MPIGCLSGEACHSGADEVRQTFRLFGVMRGDVEADHILCSGVEDAGGLARDFGPHGITVNVVQPGPIDTDGNPADGPMKELLHTFMAVKRHGRPEEVAGR